MKQTFFDHCYSDGIEHKKIALLGILPPPLGGVSVHIQRVKHKFEKQGNTVFVFTTEKRYRNWLFPWYILTLFVWLLYRRPHILFYHSSYVTTGILEIAMLALYKRFFGFSLSIIEHDCRHMYLRSLLAKKLYNSALRAVDTLVFIGDKTYKSYCDAYMALPAHSIEGAFLPPVLEEKERILATYPPELFSFIESKQKIILANAAHCMRINDADVYGLDRCIAMMADITCEINDVGLIIALATHGDSAYFATLSQAIAQHGLEKNIFILIGNYELWPLFFFADLFVRPTLSDGASISIQEALFYNVPVVASNVCARPDNVVCFDIAQPQSFSHCVKNILQAHQKS